MKNLVKIGSCDLSVSSMLFFIPKLKKMILNIYLFSISAEDVTMGRDLEISIRRNCDLALEPKDEPLTKTTGIMRQDNSFEKSASKWKMKVGKGPLDLSSESPSSKQRHEDGGLGFKAMSDHLQDNREPEAPNIHCKTLDTGEAAVINSNELMQGEHSSKRHRGIKDDGPIIRDDRNVLRRSEGSAFSRYFFRIINRSLKFCFLFYLYNR